MSDFVIENGALIKYEGNEKEVVVPKGLATIGYHAFIACNDLKIYAEAGKKPKGWAEGWNPDNLPVVWDSKRS